MRMKRQNDNVYVKYNTFETTDKEKYVLKINGFSGNVTVRPKAINYNKSKKFATFDSDNVGSLLNGTDCSFVLLNAQYKLTNSGRQIVSHPWNHQPEFVEMLILYFCGDIINV